MNLRKCLYLPILSLLCCLPVAAATVYKSVDENGIITYSDTRPTENITVETMVIDAEAPERTEQEEQRLLDMRETTDRMASDRMAREKHRAEMRQLQAETAAQQQQQYPQFYESETLYTGYNNYPVHRPWHRPGLRPEHPIARPPLRPRPPHGNIRPSTGDNFPAPHIRPLFTPTVRGGRR